MADTQPPPGGTRPRTVATGYVTGGRTDGSGMFVEFVADDGDDQQQEGQAADDPDPAGYADREWDLGLLFVVASGGRLFFDANADGMADLCALLHHLTGHRVLSVHLADACDVARDHVREHLDCWDDVAPVLTSGEGMSREEVLGWLADMRERFGAGQQVPPMPDCTWVPQSALEILADAFRIRQAASARENAEQARQSPHTEPQWPMACVLQVAIGNRMLVTSDDFAALHALLCHLTNTTMIMISFARAGSAVREHVRGQLPWLEEAEASLPPEGQDVAVWLAQVQREHGTHVRVDPSGEAYPHVGPSPSDTDTIIDFIASQERD